MVGFLVQFNVAGEPVSLQARNKTAKRAWMALVKQASFAGHSRGTQPYQGDVRVAIYYFASAPMQGDIDNIVKPILDAMCNRVYDDDHAVATVLVRKIEPGQAIATTNPSPTLISALTTAKPLVHIRISDNPGGEPL